MTAKADVIMDLQHVGFTYSTRAGIRRHSKIEALSDINFSIFQGETLGLIGRNGCGKSTLLRILTGIYQPEKGIIDRRCERIALLSLSVGFDKELSGSNNLILASMFLGSSKKKALELHDEIVEFAGLENFIEQPMKTYSSGMKARLGFAVAIKMEADLLLIDEVLGVGDAAFRQKARNALLDRINSDQSVVFVSHQMDNVIDLCERVIWLENGRIRESGKPSEVVAMYMEHMKDAKGVGNRSAQSQGMEA